MISYTLAGSGPAVVFIHGFCEDKSLWEDYTKRLSAHYTVICLDLPGFGDSAPEFAEAVSMEYYARRVHELLDTLVSSKDQVSMIGHSLGGYVALAYAELYPERLNGIGLFHSSAFADNEEKKESRDKVAQYIQDKGVPAFTNNFVEPLFYPGNRARLAKEIRVVTQKAGRTSKEGAVSATLAMKERVDRIAVLKQTTLPVLFIVGKNDNAVPFEKSLEQCHLPAKSMVLFLDKVAHMGMIEAKEECLKMIKAFLEFSINNQ